MESELQVRNSSEIRLIVTESVLTPFEIPVEDIELSQKILAFRHGHSLKNDPAFIREALQDGHTDRDFPLSPRGLEEAELLKENLPKYIKQNDIEGNIRIIHSPYFRTAETAKFIERALREMEETEDIKIVGVDSDERLRDHNSGLTLGHSHDEIKMLFPAYAEEMDKYPTAYLDATPPEGENKRECISRVKSFLRDLEKYDEHIVLVTHFDVIVYLIALYGVHASEEERDKSMLNMLSTPELWNSTASVTQFEIEKGEPPHLKERFVKIWE